MPANTFLDGVKYKNQSLEPNNYSSWEECRLYSSIVNWLNSHDSQFNVNPLQTCENVWQPPIQQERQSLQQEHRLWRTAMPANEYLPKSFLISEMPRCWSHWSSSSGASRNLQLCHEMIGDFNQFNFCFKTENTICLTQRYRMIQRQLTGAGVDCH